MNIYKWIPNALSFSRTPIAFVVAIYALRNQWTIAFIFLAIGLLTDGLDGFLAVRLNVKSDFGGKFLDPANDFSLTAGSLWGLVFTKTLPWSIVWLLVAISVIIWTPIFFKKAENRTRLVCEGLASFYYLAVILGFVVIYAFKAFGVNTLWLLVLAVPMAVITVKIKQHRLAIWIKKIIKK